MTPDDFRVQVYGSRWYQDLLPACDIAAETSDRWPAVSTVKKAWGKPFRKKLPGGDVVPLDAYWAATYTVDHLDELVVLPKSEILERVAKSASHTLNRAADRGTSIHTVIEDLVVGQIVDDMFLPDDARPYVAACRAFVDQCHPVPLLAECVAINRTLGYGGTFDAIIEIDGKFYLVDWKTRNDKHGAYEEEAAQIGGYSLAEYVVHEGVRKPMPALDGGLIVSITREGFALYPVDLVEAADAFRAMLVCWQEKRAGTKQGRHSIGDPFTLSAAPDRAGWLADKIRQLRDTHPAAVADLAREWPADVPTLKAGGHSAGQLEQIALVLSVVEARHGVLFGNPDPNSLRPNKTVIAGLVARLQALPADVLDAVTTVAKNADIPNVEGRKFTVGHIPALEELLVDAETLAEIKGTPDGVQDNQTAKEPAA